MRVLVTRPIGQASAWVDGLRQRGLDAVSLPLIRIEGPPALADVAAAWASLGRRDLVVFVSPSAAEAFFAHAPPGATWPPRLRVASPGPGTTAALTGLGIARAQVIAAADDAPQFDSEALWQRLATEDWREASV